MTCKERSELMRKILEEEIIPLGLAKGYDYSGENDCFSNLRDFGWKGIVVRMGDKYHRTKNFIKNNQLKVESEKIEDTLLDLINYSFFALIMLRMEKVKEVIK